MWQPIRIDIQNLFSHYHSSYEFKGGKCVVIFGSNKDDKSLQNNGSGKTTLFEAVSIALTNESLRSIKKDAFINREADSCKIEFELDNPVLKKRLKIVRQFFRSNKPVRVEIWENGELNRQVTSVNEANKRIIDLIGISRDDLLRYYIISQDNHYTFFTASDTEKKEIMNRITSADMIQPIIEELNDRAKAKDDEYKSLEHQSDKLSDRKEILTEQRQELLNDRSYAHELQKEKDAIGVAEAEIEEFERTAKSYEKKKADAESLIAEIEIKDVTELIDKRKKLKEQLENVEEKVTENGTLKRKLKREIDLAITCPNCGKEFVPDSQIDLTPEEIRAVVKEIDAEIAKGEKKQEQLELQLKQVRKDISEAEKNNDRKNELDAMIKKYERQAKRARESVLELKVDISKHQERIRTIKANKEHDALLKKIETQIKEVEAELKKLNESLKPVQEEIDLIKFWQFNMGKNGFSTFLANKSIKIIEGITNSYLRKFGTDISVLINGFKILKDGSVREKIDVFVMNDGITAEPFMSKSGGERGRVTLAGILGIQHLINLSLNGKGMNLLLLDEVFPGVDAMGQEKIIKVLENMGITIMLITQNVSESFNNENTLYVVKENGVSRYV